MKHQDFEWWHYVCYTEFMLCILEYRILKCGIEFCVWLAKLKQLKKYLPIYFIKIYFY